MTRPPDEDSTGGRTTSRRALLRAAGAGVAAGGLVGPAAATRESGRDRDPGAASIDLGGDDPPYSAVQGLDCMPLAPLSGDQPVESLYDLRIPERFEGHNGATDPGSGPYYESLGTRHLQRRDTTITFLYDGPEGLSLVVVHDRPDGSGGSATWHLEVPLGARWAVKDDFYLLSRTGEPAPTNFDRWETGGLLQTVDWTWGPWATDGGALRGLGEVFVLAISPEFNEAADLWEDHYSGRVTDWELLSWHGDGVERYSLSLDDALVVGSEGCPGGL